MLASRGGSLIEEAELSGSDEGKWCTTYLSVPEAMPEKLAIPNQLVKKTPSLSSLKHVTKKWNGYIIQQCAHMQTSIMNEWKTNSKLGAANPKVQAMKPDDAEVPGYIWDMCALGL
jgi:hypothetical protein